MNDMDKHHLMIDRRLEAYKSFFSHKWARQILETTKGTKVESLAFMLTVNVRGAANCHALPWLMINSLSGLSLGFLKADRLSNVFVDTLAQEMSHKMSGRIPRMKVRELEMHIREFAAKVNKAAEQPDPTDVEFSPEGLWQEYFTQENYEWLFALWGSQRLVFGSLFFAYEGFVKEVVAIALNDPQYKGFPNQIASDMKQHFGEEIAEKCLAGEFIEISKAARNALVHNSGKESEQLARFGDHGLSIVDGVLQIQCPDNEILCRGIESRSLLLAKAAAAHSAFRH